MRTLHKDHRVAIATVLYKQGKISLGKATEIAEMSYEELKKMFVAKGIPLSRGAQSTKELRDELKQFL